MEKTTYAPKTGDQTLILGRTAGSWTFIALAVVVLVAICLY